MSWIEQLPSGGYRLVDRVKINGKIRKISVPLDRDTPQARRKATEALNKKIRTIAQPTSEMTLSAAITDYQDLKDCRNSTLKNVKYSMKKCETLFGDVRLSELTAASIRRTFYKSDLEPTVVNRTLSAFKTFLEWCVQMEYLEENPAKNVKPLKIDAPPLDPESLYLEPDRLKELLKNLDGMAYYMTRFLALTGMRIGEASALTPEDIGPKYISVTKSYSSRENEVTKPKNSSSIREIFIQPELKDLINEFLKWRNLNIMAYGIRPTTLFYSKTGDFYREQYLGRELKPYGCHPHMLRHTHVALLAEQGMTLEAIARRIGHKGTKVTQAVYYHITQKQRQKDEEKMAKIRLL